MRKFSALLLYIAIISQSFASTSLIDDKRKNSLSFGSEFIFENYPNQELISIRLLGSVKNAGIYHVPNNTNITTLLSLAGGTNQDADIENISIKKGGNERTTYKLNLQDVLKDVPNKNEVLNANDIVYVAKKNTLISSEISQSLSFTSIFLTSLLTVLLIKEKAIK